MTVPTTTNKVVYAGDGTTTVWPFSFSVLLSTDIKVYLTDAIGNLTLLSSGLYSVDLANSRVTYPLSGSAIGVGTKLTILRNVDYLQNVDWKNQGAFDAEVLEGAEDKITMALQQLNESLSRCVQYSVDQTPSDTTTATILASVNAAVAALANVQAMTYLTPTANSPANTTVAVAAGKFTKSDGSGTVTYAGGQSPAFSVVSANSRIDLLCIDDTGTLSIVQGIQAASPVPAQYPALKTVIAEVTINETSGVTVTSGDIKDVRPTLNGNFQQAYVDSLLWKAPVKAATTAALAANTYANGVLGYGATLTASANGALAAVDGITLSVGDRVLVKDEVAGANKGIYVVTQLGDASHPYILTRSADACIAAALGAGLSVRVQQGTVNGNLSFVQTTTGAIVVGTTVLVFALAGEIQNVSQNILDNGGFEIWQRGASFSAPANQAYLADRWFTTNNEAANVTVTKEASTLDTGLASMKVVVASAGASKNWFLQQYIENYADFRGKTLTISVRVNSNVAGTIRVGIVDSAGAITAQSSYHTGGGGWETLTATINVSAIASSNTYVWVGMFASGDKKNGTYYFDSAMLVPGPAAVAFVPTDPALDLARCQRFYHRICGNIVGEMVSTGHCTSGTNIYGMVRHPVTMRAAPTVSVVGPTGFLAYNAAGATVATTAVTSFSASIQSVQLGFTLASGMVAGNSSLVFSNATTSYIEVSADL